jgi:hypothetical protein
MGRVRADRAAAVLVMVAPLLWSLASLPPDVSAQATVREWRKLVVDNNDQRTAAELGDRGGAMLVDYGAFSLWSVPDAVVPDLQGRASVTIHDDFDTIPLRGGVSIDTRGSPPAVPADLQQTRASGPQFWLVQFVGPIKEEWLNDLRTLELEIVTSMPYNAYVVWGDGAALANLDALAVTNPVIQYTGPYHPAYRLEPSLQQARQIGDPSDPVSVTVQLYATKDTDQSVAALRALGGQVYREPSTVTTLTDISLDLPKGQLTAVASWPDVFNVERYAPPSRI